MRFIHIADLHIGKNLRDRSLIEDQAYILDQILDILQSEKPDVLLIAGDIYDQSRPSAEAVSLVGDFFCRLGELPLEVFAISGNHDSPERLAYASRILAEHHIHIASGVTTQLPCLELEDRYGPLRLYALPFMRPASLRLLLPEGSLSYRAAMESLLASADIEAEARNILLLHQFVSGAYQDPLRSASEQEIQLIGGLEAIPTDLFDAFDYVALGHLHRPQSVGREGVRYAGSPLKYSFSECAHEKSLTLISLAGKNQLKTELIPLRPRRDMREIRGGLKQLLRDAETDSAKTDYIRAILTDDEERDDPFAALRRRYPNLLALDFDNARTRAEAAASPAEADDWTPMDPEALFLNFFREQQGRDAEPGERAALERCLRRAKEEAEEA